MRRRILTYVIVLIVVINLDFFLPRLEPGNAAEVLVTGGSNPLQQIQLREARFGLNQPLYIQYFIFLKGLFASWPPNLGISYAYYPQSVWDLFLSRIGWTLLLILSSLALSIVLAYFMVAYSSQRRGGKFEIGALYSSIAFQAIPVYWTAIVLLWLFSFTTHWFPAFGNVDANLTSELDYIGSIIWHGVLPILAMTVSILGENYLILRSSSQDVLRSDYVLAAKTRGLRGRIVASRYILRNSLLPFISISSFSIASLISRVILVESVFGYNGVGDLIVDGVLNHDYPVLEGSLLLITLIIIVGGIIGDLLIVKADPRVASSGGTG